MIPLIPVIFTCLSCGVCEERHRFPRERLTCGYCGGPGDESRPMRREACVKKSNKRYHRRELRKAKASKWRRQPKAHPKKVGHGPN